MADPNGSRFAAALVRTRAAVWVVDLLGEPGVVINGAPCRAGRLEDGDVLTLGAQSIRLTYDPVRPPGGEGPGTPEDVGQPLALDDEKAVLVPARPILQPPIESGIEVPVRRGFVPGPALRPTVERAIPDSATTDSGPFAEALGLLVGLLRDVHRDHLTLVREELAEIHRLGEKMASLQAQLSRPDPPPVSPLPPDEPEPWPESPRPDPATVQFLVGERLASWERERDSRWRKVLDLLAGSRS
jgi:hypothetical protein